MLDIQDAVRLQGADLVDRNGEKVGSIDDIYVDEKTDEPQFALVNTGLFGTRSHFVPLADATETGDGLRVPYTKDQIEDAPSLDADGDLSESEEAAIYHHYGLGDSDSRSDSGLAAGTSEDAAEAARARLRRHAVDRDSTR